VLHELAADRAEERPQEPDGLVGDCPEPLARSDAVEGEDEALLAALGDGQGLRVRAERPPDAREKPIEHAPDGGVLALASSPSCS